MASDRAIEVRDKLNGIIDMLLVDQDDQEANILACCIALAVEEVEKWMYHGEFTPSVAPYREGHKWKGIPSGQASKESVPETTDEEFGKLLFKMKTFQRMKVRAQTNPIVIKDVSPLDKYEPGDWDQDTMRAFRDANRPVFICVRSLIPGFDVPIKVAAEYASRMAKAYPHLWGADVKKGKT